jgi:DNA polymerase alpha subunit A
MRLCSHAAVLTCRLSYRLSRSGTYFSKAFGTQTSCLERLLLKRKVMGPGWLKLSGVVPATSASTWAKYELTLPQVRLT